MTLNSNISNIHSFSKPRSIAIICTFIIYNIDNNKEDTLDYAISGRVSKIGGHFGRHLGFLSSPPFMPIYAGGFINYKHFRTFWYITVLVKKSVWVHLHSDPESHPTIFKSSP